MALLEEIDAVEQEIEANRADRSASEAEAAKVASALAEAEARIEAELAEVAGRRARAIAGLPDAVVAEYERLRGRERLGGRAAVALVDGGCGGCRVKLPVLEYNTMRAQPEDALLSCVRCGRILIR